MSDDSKRNIVKEVFQTIMFVINRNPFFWGAVFASVFFWNDCDAWIVDQYKAYKKAGSISAYLIPEEKKGFFNRG